MHEVQTFEDEQVLQVDWHFTHKLLLFTSLKESDGQADKHLLFDKK